MTGRDIPDPAEAKRGRPFSEKTEAAILSATSELLAEKDLADITIEEVAARAHVGKASVYRRWSSKGTLAFDAFERDFLARQPLPATGELRGDLLAAMRSWVRTVRDTPTGRTLRGLIAEVQRDPALQGIWRDRFIGPVRSQHRQMVDRAIARGEIAPETDPDLVMDLLYGAAYHRLLQGHLPLNDQFVRALVDAVMSVTTTPRRDAPG
jgi:AcrR family transcriptional regulator